MIKIPTRIVVNIDATGETKIIFKFPGFDEYVAAEAFRRGSKQYLALKLIEVKIKRGLEIIRKGI